MIMSGQNKVRTPGKIRISIFRVMCQKNMYPRHERCPEKFFQLCETEFWRIRFVIIFDRKFQSVKDKISSTKIRRYALIMQKAHTCTSEQPFIIQVLLPYFRIQKHLILMVSKRIKNRYLLTQTAQKHCCRLKRLSLSVDDHISGDKNCRRIMFQNSVI